MTEKETFDRHNLTVRHSNIRSPEEIIKAEEQYLGRHLTTAEQQRIHDQVKYLKEHQGFLA
jgi:hypothetical protein